MKITFDSNVWQIITLPEDYPTDPMIEDFKKIRTGILENRIEPYLSETIFTIEAIRRDDRKDVLGKRKAKISYTQSEEYTGATKMSFNLSSEKGINFDGNPILKRYFDKAIELGFRVVRLPRIGGLQNEDVVPYLFKVNNFQDYFDKAAEVTAKINNAGAGHSQIETIGRMHHPDNWHIGIKIAPQGEGRKIAKAAAEWADGDSVSISIGLNCDYFCTRDQASSAGQKSVLSQQNLDWLNKEYGFRTILPQDLSVII